MSWIFSICVVVACVAYCLHQREKVKQLRESIVLKDKAVIELRDCGAKWEMTARGFQDAANLSNEQLRFWRNNFDAEHKRVLRLTEALGKSEETVCQLRREMEDERKPVKSTALTRENRAMREVNNIMNYIGSDAGQENLDEPNT